MLDLGTAAIDMVEALHQGGITLGGHLHRIVLGPGADAGVVFAGAVEEVGVGLAGHEHRQGHAAVLQLVAQGEGEGVDEGLGGAVDGLEGNRRGGRDGGGEEHPAAAGGDHLRQHQLGQVHGGHHIELDQCHLVFQARLADEGAAQADPGVEHHDVQRAALATQEAKGLFHTHGGAQVGRMAPDLDPQGTQFALGGVQPVAAGDQQQIMAVAGQLLGQFEADAAGGTGDGGQRPGNVAHAEILCRPGVAGIVADGWRSPRPTVGP